MSFARPVVRSSIPAPLQAAAVATALLAAPVHGAPIGADAIAADAPVAVVVRVPKPWYAPRWLVANKMRDTIPQYASIDGLAYKVYTFAHDDGRFGGLYLWTDAARARAHFGAAWFERVRRERGVDGEVRFFEVLAAIDNVQGGTPKDIDASAVVTVVLLPVPAGIDRRALAAQVDAAVPTYRSVAGLLRKYFVATRDGRFGGIYVWKDRAAADAWFTHDWHARAQASYGAAPDIEWYDAPILLPSALASNRVRVTGL